MIAITVTMRAKLRAAASKNNNVRRVTEMNVYTSQKLLLITGKVNKRPLKLSKVKYS